MIDAEVKNYISQSLSVPLRKVQEDASLFHDLGVDGDDAREFLDEFSEKFDVNFTDLKLDEYFGEEAAINPISFLTELFNKKNYRSMKRLEVRYLIEKVEKKRNSI